MTQQTARGLAALGRGPDSMLIHMAPGEVQSLQALAEKHGGSLTINPATGLPEAGFLSSILPMVIGAGLMAASGGTAAPLIAGMSNAATIGLGVGGLQTLRTGSLSKGLMAGLGAYGGAGLAGGLMGAGTGALSSAAGAGAPQVAAESLVPQAITPAVTAPVATAAAPAATTGFGGIGADASVMGYQAAPAATTTLAQGIQTATPTISQAELASQAMQSQQAALINDQAAARAVGSKLAATTPTQAMGAGIQSATASPGAAWDFVKANKMPLGAIGLSALGGMQPDALNAPAQNQGMIRPYTYSREKIPGAFEDVAGAPMSSKERRYFTDQYTAGTPYAAPGPEYTAMAAGGPVEAMSNANAIGANTGYPQADIRTGAYATPYQQPMSQNVVTGAQDAAVDPYTGQMAFAEGGETMAGGGVSHLGDYSDGGRLLRGPGDGISDSIPATIGNKRPARLADGEFVVPARIVSELGNGSTEAGARKLYAMMDRVQKSRGKTVGKGKVATNSRASKHLPA